MRFDSTNFEIYITNAEMQDTRVRAMTRSQKKRNVKKTKVGKKISNAQVALYTIENKMIEKIKGDEDIRDEFLEDDKEIDLKIAGKRLGYTSTLLLNSDKKPCYNFTEYTIKKDREGRIIPCEVCGEVHCQHRIKQQTTANVNTDERPVRWVKQMMIDKLEALKKWSFDKSYLIRHTDGLSYNYLYEMAKSLHESRKLVLVAPVESGKVQKVVIRNGGKASFMFLEGRIKGKEYALIMHRTTLKKVD